MHAFEQVSQLNARSSFDVVSATAYAALAAGISVVPIRADGTKQPALSGWRAYQQRMPSSAELEAWFAHPSRSVGLALVTGSISGGLIALDFDDPGVFDAWRDHVRSSTWKLKELYHALADGYEERTPKGGRHLLCRCPEAFQQERKPGNQKLALRPVPPPKRMETLAETREEGGLIIVYPSHGNVHPSGRPYFLLRGSVATIRTITAAQRELLYDSVRVFDETPQKQVSFPSTAQAPRFQSGNDFSSSSGFRPGDLFNADLSVTWERLLADWQLLGQRPNRAGYLEGYWRHPGKEGPNHSATTNADGTDRLYCFSPSVGLPTSRFLSKFEFISYWHFGGDFTAAARALAEQGYTTGSKPKQEVRGEQV